MRALWELLFFSRLLKHNEEFAFTERTRNVLPNLVDQDDPKIKYINSFFVDTRHGYDDAIPFPLPSKSKPYMEQVNDSKHHHSNCSVDHHADHKVRRLSQTESIASTTDNSKLPDFLRLQFEKLDNIEKV